MRKNWPERVLAAAGAALGASMFVIVALQVFSREVVQLPFTTWSEEASRLASIYLIFIGAAVAVSRGTNLRVTYFVDKLPPRGKIAVDAVANLAAMLFALVVVYQSGKVAMHTWRFQMTTLPISSAWPYVAIPVGMIPMILVFGWRIKTSVANLLGWREGNK
jgi:TRAP-type C4-dicarboxylate transport system permease small subunit